MWAQGSLQQPGRWGFLARLQHSPQSASDKLLPECSSVRMRAAMQSVGKRGRLCLGRLVWSYRRRAGSAVQGGGIGSARGTCLEMGQAEGLAVCSCRVCCGASTPPPMLRVLALDTHCHAAARTVNCW